MQPPTGGTILTAASTGTPSTPEEQPPATTDIKINNSTYTENLTGSGLWHADPAAKRYGQRLRDRGKPGGIICCALAHRANKIAYALVRDQAGYDPARWA